MAVKLTEKEWENFKYTSSCKTDQWQH